MTSTATLTSLAILKVNIDHGNDYLDYLRPFVAQVLYDYKFDPVEASDVKRSIHDQYGLDIPEPCIQIVLRRFRRDGYIRREHGFHHITSQIS